MSVPLLAEAVTVSGAEKETAVVSEATTADTLYLSFHGVKHLSNTWRQDGESESELKADAFSSTSSFIAKPLISEDVIWGRSGGKQRSTASRNKQTCRLEFGELSFSSFCLLVAVNPPVAESWMKRRFVAQLELGVKTKGMISQGGLLSIKAHGR